LKKELDIFSEKFKEKSYVIVGTKSDLAGSESARLQFERIVGEPVIMVSARDSINLSMLVRKFRNMVYNDADSGPEDLNTGK
jgi:tRNA U34 5-carboxymethylaminomethyl modifying GTPase MnmE/TrmE